MGSREYHQVLMFAYRVLDVGQNSQQMNDFIGFEEPSSFQNKTQAAA